MANTALMPPPPQLFKNQASMTFPLKRDYWKQKPVLLVKGIRKPKTTNFEPKDRIFFLFFSLFYRRIAFFLLWGFVILWKKPVYLFSSFSHKCLDFCLQNTASTTFLNSSLASSLPHTPQQTKLYCCQSCPNPKELKETVFMTIKTPKTSSFHPFKKILTLSTLLLICDWKTNWFE